MSVFNWVRGQVSKKKRRLKEGHFDLDLSYINDRIIAMGYPAQGFESLYRNSFNDVKEFLDEKHGDNYMIYNLCSERSYNPEDFCNRVQRFPFDDHNPPKLDMIRQFCNHASEWLSSDPQHVVVVHCKAGKGRTGTMICSLLLHLGLYKSSQEAMQHYAENRTLNEKGITIPSQIRYVRYYEQYLNGGFDRNIPFVPSPCLVKRVRFVGIPPQYFPGVTTLQLYLMDAEEVFESNGNNLDGPTRNEDERSLDYNLDGCFPSLVGDFKISAMKNGKEIWYIWLNSEFVKEDEIFFATDVDKASKSKVFTDEFQMEVYASH
ncbi:phosphatidylinositol 3,4,5-trisphosphate 3-phosphatase [Histomonas meleagridis]|uniref:phosphatidylinositol 3,4,5-trisphosphate 3-phosphatase n=1 Tax=Histomonas meleagridis TaxID=135588 RepID=UPI00355AC17F|nr:phosphatidylinositol 3,4,5-trisphosphate 3-phosphatase [Histomonas meleagridis]KAH0797937.1 phosphatidylinositol 3,4,5-trisphosphate 3-phosphatase [Histomonas meleagridis]